MAVLSKIAKSVLKETAEEATEKTIKEVVPSVAKNLVKKTAEEVASTAISKEAKAVAKAAAITGERQIGLEQAKKATKTAYQFAAQKDVQLGKAVTDITEWAKNLKMQKEAGVITDKQAVGLSKELREKFLPILQSKEETRVARSGPGQILKEASENQDIVMLNKTLEGAETYLNEHNIWQNVEILSNLRNQKELEALGAIKADKQVKGKLQSFYDNATHIGKNIMLVANPTNRLADAGANILTRGVSLLDLTTAEALQKAGKRLYPVFKGKVLGEILSAPGIYEGSAARSLNGSAIAVTDYLINGSKNIGRWMAGRGENIVETTIGKHSRKMRAQYVWQTQNEVADFVLPKDIKDMFSILKNNPVKAPAKAVGKTIYDGGFALSSAMDSTPGGAFRAGDLAQDAYQKAYLRATDVAKGEDKEFIDRLAKDYILFDEGKPISKNKLDEYMNLFGPGWFEDAAISVSESATRSAERDTLRTKSVTLVGKGAEELYSGLMKLPLIGKYFELKYPLARAPIRMLDRVVYENPFSSFKRVRAAYKKAKLEIERTGTTNSAEFYKEMGVLVNGAAAYTGVTALAASGFLMGDMPEDKGKRALLEKTNKKANSINFANMSIPFERWGKAGVLLGYIANIAQDIQDIHDNYEDDSNTYGWADASGALIGAFTTNLAWPIFIGRLLDDHSAGYATKSMVKQYAKLLPRAMISLAQDLGVKNDDEVLQVFIDVRKKLSDTRLTLMPKTDAFGDNVKKNSYTREQDSITREWDRIGFRPQMPRDTYTASVNDEDLNLLDVERAAWNSFMSHYEIFDSNGEPTGEYSSVEKELFSLIHGGRDATPEGDLYNEIGNTELSPEGERLANQRNSMQKVYAEAKRNALLTFLSYRNKNVDTEEGKRYNRLARMLWDRSISAKKKRMKPIPSLNVGE